MSEWIEITAKTVEEAVTEAAIKLGVTSSKVEYKVMEEEKSGFLGLFSKPAKIKAKKKEEATAIDEKLDKIKESSVKDIQNIDSGMRLKDTRKSDKKPEKKVEKKPERKIEKNQHTEEQNVNVAEDIDMDAIENATREFLGALFKAMNIEVTVSMDYNKSLNTLNINLEGSEMGLLIGKRGQTLDALQYLITSVVNKQSSVYMKVKLDTENYRDRRRMTLENLAKNIAFKVKKTKRSVALEPMTPYERRIIHSTLQNDKYVETHSEGEEPYRKVVVTLKKGYRDYSGKNGYGKRYNRDRRDYNKKYVNRSNEENSQAEASMETASSEE